VLFSSQGISAEQLEPGAGWQWMVQRGVPRDARRHRLERFVAAGYPRANLAALTDSLKGSTWPFNTGTAQVSSPAARPERRHLTALSWPTAALRPDVGSLLAAFIRRRALHISPAEVSRNK
jgi:hypothetical protein